MIDHLAMDEAAIERTVEMQINRADARFLRGTYNQAMYDAKIEEINAWAKAEYAKAKVRP